MSSIRQRNLMKRTEEYIVEHGSASFDDHDVDSIADKVDELEQQILELEQQIDALIIAADPQGSVYDENTGRVSSEMLNGALPSDPGEENLDGGDAGSSKSFSISISGTTATVAAGTIRLQGSNEAIAETDVTLSGTDPYIYVYEYVDHSTRGIAFSASEPVSDATRWVWVLAKVTGSDPYDIEDGDVFHDGDVHAQWMLK